MAKKTSKPVLERLYAKTIIPLTEDGTNDDSRCWIWNGAINNSGYGLIRTSVKMRLVTRVVFDEQDTLASSSEVQHTCGNRRCVNPNHLYVGNVNTRKIVYVKPTTLHWTQAESFRFVCPTCNKPTNKLWYKRYHKECIEQQNDSNA